MFSEPQQRNSSAKLNQLVYNNEQALRYMEAANEMFFQHHPSDEGMDNGDLVQFLADPMGIDSVPEVQTSYNMCVSQTDGPRLTGIPVEILQNIVRCLDDESLCLLRLTSKDMAKKTEYEVKRRIHHTLTCNFKLAKVQFLLEAASRDDLRAHTRRLRFGEFGPGVIGQSAETGRAWPAMRRTKQEDAVARNRDGPDRTLLYMDLESVSNFFRTFARFDNCHTIILEDGNYYHHGSSVTEAFRLVLHAMAQEGAPRITSFRFRTTWGRYNSYPYGLHAAPEVLLQPGTPIHQMWASNIRELVLDYRELNFNGEDIVKYLIASAKSLKVLRLLFGDTALAGPIITNMDFGTPAEPFVPPALEELSFGECHMSSDRLIMFLRNFQLTLKKLHLYRIRMLNTTSWEDVLTYLANGSLPNLREFSFLLCYGPEGHMRYWWPILGFCDLARVWSEELEAECGGTFEFLQPMVQMLCDDEYYGIEGVHFISNISDDTEDGAKERQRKMKHTLQLLKEHNHYIMGKHNMRLSLCATIHDLPRGIRLVWPALWEAILNRSWDWLQELCWLPRPRRFSLTEYDSIW